MRRMTGCCLMMLLSGCASQQAAHDETASATPVQTSSALLVAKMMDSQPTPRQRQAAGHAAIEAQELGYQDPDQVKPGVVRAALLKQYNAWAGTRYRYGGMTHRGIDCSALMQHVFRDGFDYRLPRTTLGQVTEGEHVSKSKLLPGDLVFFRPYRGDRHVGVYVGEGYFMHASTSQGVKLSRLSNPYWQRHYWTARRTMDNSQLAARLGASSRSDGRHGFMNSADY